MNKHLISLAETTLLMLEKRSWQSIKIDEVYNKIKINKKNLQNKVANKRDLLRNINHYFDFKLRNITDSIDQSTRKDMIFEIIMMRLIFCKFIGNLLLRFLNSLRKNLKN